MLTCDNLSYKQRFGGLGFSLVPGALLAVYGQNATGLLMLLAGKLSPTRGVITFENVPIKRAREYWELMLYITPQQKLRFWERVENSVARLAKKGGGSAELVEAALRYWGLMDVRNSKCGSLPPHMKKRVILTQLLTLPRPIWLLDQPEAYLDIEGMGMLDSLMANRCNQDGIVILATGREGFMSPLPALFMDDFH